MRCLAGRLDWLSGMGQVDVWIEGYFARPYIQCVGFDVCCRKGMAVQFFRSNRLLVSKDFNNCSFR